MGQRGFSPILAIILVVIITVGGYLAYQTVNKSPSTPPPNQVACTQDTKLCSDGTAVGRTGPKCDFSPCPLSPKASAKGDTPKESTSSADTTNWKTYINTKYGFTIDYPTDWNLSTENYLNDIKDYIIFSIKKNPSLSIPRIELYKDFQGDFCVQSKTLISIENVGMVERINCGPSLLVNFKKDGNNFYLISTAHDQEDGKIFDQILFTFKFLP